MTMTADSYVDRVLDALPRATPRREQIATELRGHIAERRAAGQTEQDVLRQLGDPFRLAESYLTAVPLESATFVSRAAAKIIDVVAVIVFLAPVVGIAWASLPSEIAPFAVLIGVVATSWSFALYVIVGELLRGKRSANMSSGCGSFANRGRASGWARPSFGNCRCSSRFSPSMSSSHSLRRGVSGHSSCSPRHASFASSGRCCTPMLHVRTRCHSKGAVRT